jgi:hypothetical protein
METDNLQRRSDVEFPVAWLTVQRNGVTFTKLFLIFILLLRWGETAAANWPTVHPSDDI